MDQYTYTANLYIAEGVEKGRAKSLQAAMRAVVHGKLRVVTAKDRAAIKMERSERATTQLLRALSTARTAAKVREILSAARSHV